MAQEQFNLLQQDAQAKAQILRYEDELARKRMQVRKILFMYIHYKSRNLISLYIMRFIVY